MKDIIKSTAPHINDFLNYIMHHTDHSNAFLFIVLSIIGVFAIGALIWLSIEMTKDSPSETAEREAKKMAGTSNTFQNISDEQAEELYNKFRADGLSEDDAFNEVYAIDCNADEENEDE